MLHAVRCLLFVECCVVVCRGLVFVVRCVLGFVICFLLCVVRCLLFVVYCWWCVLVCCLLIVVRCFLLVV